MGLIRIVLYDFDTVTQQPKEPLVAELEYDPNMSLAEQGYKKIAITAGDDVGCGTIMVPLHMLSVAVAEVMRADEQRTSPIIMPDRKIIKPN